VFGLNCSTGPTEMMPSIRWLNEQEELPILVVPNAGMPLNEGGKAIYKMSPSEMADRLGDFVTRFDRVRIIGGCCGTDANHIYELRKMLERQEK
jgi:5-methyltetrahydrofolate--homocysteine methyltransferase